MNLVNKEQIERVAKKFSDRFSVNPDVAAIILIEGMKMGLDIGLKIDDLVRANKSEQI